MVRKWVIFGVGEEQVALPVSSLREVLPLPLSVEPRRGWMRYRDRDVPLVDGRELLGLELAVNAAPNRPGGGPRALAVVVVHRGRWVALVVDRVVGVERWPEGARVLDPQTLGRAGHARVLAGR